jgi:hypothetical protein
MKQRLQDPGGVVHLVNEFVFIGTKSKRPYCNLDLEAHIGTDAQVTCFACLASDEDLRILAARIYQEATGASANEALRKLWKKAHEK